MRDSTADDRIRGIQTIKKNRRGRQNNAIEVTIENMFLKLRKYLFVK